MVSVSTLPAYPFWARKLTVICRPPLAALRPVRSRCTSASKRSRTQFSKPISCTKKLRSQPRTPPRAAADSTTAAPRRAARITGIWNKRIAYEIEGGKTQANGVRRGR